MKRINKKKKKEVRRSLKSLKKQKSKKKKDLRNTKDYLIEEDDLDLRNDLKKMLKSLKKTWKA